MLHKSVIINAVEISNSFLTLERWLINYFCPAIRLSIQTIDEHLIELESDMPTDFEKEYADKLTVLHSAIETLPQRKRSAFTLCRLEGKSYEEAAAELGISTETVKDYVKSAAKLLREYVVAQRPQMSALSISCLVILLNTGA